MKDHKAEYRRIEIANDARVETERQLLRMNIHHLSLFPDADGLARYRRQKTRLHWATGDTPVIVEEEAG